MATYFKVFFSKNEETKWLNTMGEKGYLLNKKKFCRYYFTKNDKQKYAYSVEHLDFPVKSEQGIEYLSMRENNKENFLFKKGSWSYFYAIDKISNLSSNAKKKIANLYLWRSIYLLFFSLFSWVLCGYHMFAVKYIESYGHIGDGSFDIVKINGTTFLDKLKGFWNCVIEFFNNVYFKIFTSVFGNNSVALVMSFLLPAAIILTLLFALNANEYIYWRFMSGIKSKFKTKKK